MDQSLEAFKKNFAEFRTDMQHVSETLLEWIETLSPMQKKALKEEFSNAKDLFSSPDFKNEFDSTQPFSKNSLQEALDITPESMHALYQLGYDLYQNGEIVKSRGIFRFLTILNPILSDYWIGLGTVLLHEARLNDALSIFAIANSIDPKNPESLFFMARCQMMLGHLDQALELIDQTESLSRKVMNVHCLNAALSLKEQLQQLLNK